MRFEEVTLAACDPRALAAFYAVLGFAVEGDTAKVGWTRLRFVAREPAGPVHLAFNVPEHRLADALAWIRSRAPLIAAEESETVAFPAWNAHAVYFTDPGGNILELIARHALPSAHDAPFGADAVEGVSEVGVPMPDVRAAVAELSARLREPVWRPPSDTFGTVGDEHGLLIVVRRGRPWFPTDAAAAAAPLEVKIEGKMPLRWDDAG